MDLSLKRQYHLEDQIEAEYRLLKALEDACRTAVEPITLEELELQIGKLRSQITEHTEELASLRIQPRDTSAYSYDVALSYAGEDREYAQTLADTLKSRDVKVFYDKYEKPILWGKDLYVHLSDLYQNKSQYCVIFISQHYAIKVWTKHQLKAAQDRALKESKEYILPIRLDDTEIPGILSTTGYLSWPPETAGTIADAILKKLGKLPLEVKQTNAVEMLDVPPESKTAVSPVEQPVSIKDKAQETTKPKTKSRGSKRSGGIGLFPSASKLTIHCDFPNNYHEALDTHYLKCQNSEVTHTFCMQHHLNRCPIDGTTLRQMPTRMLYKDT